MMMMWNLLCRKIQVEKEEATKIVLFALSRNGDWRNERDKK